CEDMQIHADMIRALTQKYGTSLPDEEAQKAVTAYVENVCENILENTAVFKRDETGRAAFGRFLTYCGIFR
ncbi:MAG: galactose-1-phosphate uridylyltransferase, partial [Candidatus Scatosoma sp.]